MNNKILALFILFMYVTVSFSQNELNAYKYIIIPKKYDFLKTEDKYKLNSLTEFLFNKHGFTALFQDEDFPQDLMLNPCLGVDVEIENNSKMMSTRLKIEIRDCYKKIVYTSIEGKTREKVYEKAYQEALRSAFVSFEAMNYEFDPALVANLSIALKSDGSGLPVSAEVVSPAKTEPEAVILSDPVPVIVDEPKEVEEKEVSKTEQSNPDKIESNQAEAVAEVEPALVPVPVPVKTENNTKSEDSNNTNSLLKSYKNENISFFIIEQDETLTAYVNETKDGSYKKGELIGTFVKTSIPNVYRVTWKNKEGQKKETTGYFDDAGNLKIDVMRDGNIEVVIFEIEK